MTSLDGPDRCGHYRSLSNFYLADARRIASRERDLGLWWRVGAHGPMYRAAWVADTGELYVVRLGPAEDGTGEVDVLGRARDRNELEQALAGWREVCPQPDSMTWLRHRAGALAQPEVPRVLSRELPDLALTGRRLQQVRARVAGAGGGPHERGEADEAGAGRVRSAGRYLRARPLVLAGAAVGLAAPATALVLEVAGG